MGVIFGAERLLFTILPVVIVIFFIFIFAGIVMQNMNRAKQWKADNASPVLTVEALVVTKRVDVSRHRNMNSSNMSASHSHTDYFVTFQVESGDRMEFVLEGSCYGMLAENDFGRLVFQGTRFISFDRTKEERSSSLVRLRIACGRTMCSPTKHQYPILVKNP